MLWFFENYLKLDIKVIKLNKQFRLKDYSIISYVVLDNSEPGLNSDVVVPSVLHAVLSGTTFPHCEFLKHGARYGKGRRRGGESVSACLMRSLELMGLEKNEISHTG